MIGKDTNYKTQFDLNNAETLMFQKQDMKQQISKFSSQGMLSNLIWLTDSKKKQDAQQKCLSQRVWQSRSLNQDKSKVILKTKIIIATITIFSAAFPDQTKTIQLFYCQQFIQCLQTVRKQLYQINHKSFTCYRGAYLSDQQMNILKQFTGKHIEVIGFLSINTELKIDFELINMSFQSNYEFVFIKSINNQYYEQQVQNTGQMQQQFIKSNKRVQSQQECHYSKAQKQILPVLICQNDQNLNCQDKILHVNIKQEFEKENKTQVLSQQRSIYKHNENSQKFVINDKNHQ